MAGKPRRTTELMGSSVKRSAIRQSRIAQPVKRPTSTLLSASKPEQPRRTQSTDRFSTARPSTLTFSTAKKRSHSQTPCRITQTPTTPMQRTPINNSYLQLTADKRGPVEDKLFIHSESIRITEYAIHNSVPGFAEHIKLKQIPYKQFINLISFMIEKIVGNRCPIQGNFIDDIVKALNMLEYPYTINKSWLKTPTAAHSFNHIVLMLGWLLNLIEPPLMPNQDDESIDIERLDNLIYDQDLPTIQYQKMFLESVRNGFQLWNSQEDNEFERLEINLANQFITQITHSSVKNLKELDEQVVSMEQEKTQLEKLAKPCVNYEKQMELEVDVKEKRKVIDGLKNILKTTREDLENEREKYEQEQQDLFQKEKEIDCLKQKIKDQLMSKDQFKTLMQEVFIIKRTIEAEEAQIKKLEEDNINEPIHVSLLMKQKIEKIAHLNQILYQPIFGKLLEKFDPLDYEIDHCSNEIVSQINKLRPVAQVLQKKLNESRDEQHLEIIKLDVKLQQLVSEKQMHEKLLKENTEKSALQIQELKVNQNMKQKELEQIICEIQFEKENGNDLAQKIAELNALIKTEEIAVSRISEEREIIVAKFFDEQNKALKNLEDKVMATNTMLDKFKQHQEELLTELSEQEKKCDELNETVSKSLK